MEVILIKCINGEEVLGRLHSETEDGINVTKPVTIHIGQTPSGQIGASLAPSFMGQDEGVFLIPKTAIMMKAINGPKDDLKTKYLEMTSGIALSTSL